MNNDEKLKRNRQILDEFLKGDSKAKLGRRFEISRERVGQIVKAIVGSRNPFSLDNFYEVDWKTVNTIRKSIGISHRDIADRCSVHPATIRHIVTGNYKYSRGASAVKVLLTIVEISREKQTQIQDLRKAIKIIEKSP